MRVLRLEEVSPSLEELLETLGARVEEGKLVIPTFAIRETPEGVEVNVQHRCSRLHEGKWKAPLLEEEEPLPLYKIVRDADQVIVRWPENIPFTPRRQHAEELEQLVCSEDRLWFDFSETRVLGARWFRLIYRLSLAGDCQGKKLLLVGLHKKLREKARSLALLAGLHVLHRKGDVLRYADGPTALFVVASVRPGHGWSVARYYGYQFYGGLMGAYHEQCSEPSEVDQALWATRETDTLVRVSQREREELDVTPGMVED